MIKTWVAACLAWQALAPLGSARADDAPARRCALTYEAARQSGETRAGAQDHTKFIDFAGIEAIALLKAINNNEPGASARTLIADRILVLERPDSDSVKIVLFVRDCATIGANMNEEAWRKLKVVAFGATAQ